MLQIHVLALNRCQYICLRGNKHKYLLLIYFLYYQRFYSDNLQGQLVNVNQSCTLFDQSKRVIFLSHGFIATPYNYNLSDLAAGLAQVIIFYTQEIKIQYFFL